MSAIWGAISLTGKAIKEKEKEILRDAYAQCAIDRYEELSKENVYLGCGIQYFTKEAMYERLPQVQEQTFFTADVILDNREELMAKTGSHDTTVPDGALLYAMLQKYGQNCANDMIGAYVSVEYEQNRNEIMVLADAVGYRYIHYLYQDGTFYFSSLMKPLEKLVHQKQINERWIADYIGQDNLNIFTESEETPVENIYRTAPGQILHISQQGIRKIQYWKPFSHVKKIRYKSDAEYKEHFLRLFRQCTESVLRSPEETAIFLSGGYDSTAVACMAVDKLKEANKKLYAFTSVPMYSTDTESGMFADETELVRKTARALGIVECTFLDMPEMNSWFDRKAYMQVCEIPYKSPQNMLWLYEGMRQARQKNARIMLGGMFGNGTISFDNAQVYFAWLLQTGHWVKLYREISALRDKQHYTRKSVLKTAVRDAMHRTSYEEKDIFANTYANLQYLASQHTDQRLQKLDKELEKCSYCYKENHKAYITLDTLRHYGEFQQRNSLFTGVIIRDPTRDKRMIEFVAAIPYDQFTHNGVRRRLIAEYMLGIVPEHIIMEKKTGRQSADLRQRLIPTQDIIWQEWMENYRRYAGNGRIDTQKAMKELEKQSIAGMSDMEIMRHIFTNILLEYLGGYDFKK